MPELWALSHLLPPVISKLSFAVSAELVPLMSAVSGLRPGRARQLLAAGIRTPQDLAMADPTQLCQQVQYLFSRQAQNLVQSAKVREREREGGRERRGWEMVLLGFNETVLSLVRLFKF